MAMRRERNRRKRRLRDESMPKIPNDDLGLHLPRRPDPSRQSRPPADYGRYRIFAGQSSHTPSIRHPEMYWASKSITLGRPLSEAALRLDVHYATLLGRSLGDLSPPPTQRRQPPPASPRSGDLRTRPKVYDASCKTSSVVVLLTHVGPQIGSAVRRTAVYMSEDSWRVGPHDVK